MNKRILRLAIPNIISNLTVPLLSSVDTALMGHLDGVYYLGVIAIGGMIFNFIYWGFGFLRMGTTGLTAQAYGHGGNEELDDYQFISSLSAGLFHENQSLRCPCPLDCLNGLYGRERNYPLGIL